MTLLGPLLVLTDRARCRTLVDTVRAALDGGADAIVLREKDLPRAERRRLAERIVALGARLVVASDAALARDVGAVGVHLAAADPWPDDADGLLIGVSCHARAEVAAAHRRGASYAMLSPIFPTASKPGYGPALGTGALAGHPAAVYALGGVGPENARACLAAGAAGVAVMGAVMAAERPDEVVRALLAALAARPER